MANNRIVNINPAHQYATTDHEDQLATIAEQHGCDIIWYYNEAEKLGHIRTIQIPHPLFVKSGIFLYVPPNRFAGGRHGVHRMAYVYTSIHHTSNSDEFLLATDKNSISDSVPQSEFPSIFDVPCDLFETKLNEVLKNADKAYEHICKSNIKNASSELESVIHHVK